MSSDGPCREGQASRLAPPVPSTRPAAHPMVHPGRYKHPALHLRYHLPGQLNMAPGGQHISRCRQPCIQADLYSSAWVRLG
jgi:hypothetical protein